MYVILMHKLKTQFYSFLAKKNKIEITHNLVHDQHAPRHKLKVISLLCHPI